MAGFNPHGSNPQRLSDFNTKGDARGFGSKQVWATVVQTSDWRPDHRYFYGDVETNLLNSEPPSSAHVSGFVTINVRPASRR
jgi:hypothetical protein